MHELSIVASIVESVLEFVEAHQVKRVLLVRLAVGELTRLEPEQLHFCYASVTSQNALAGSKLAIESVPAKVSCPHCGYAGPPKYWDEALCAEPTPTLQCPECGKQTEPLEGHDCAIKKIKYVT
ncbi:MAG: hypA [Pedosphaera sp.]|nr:hypA [Pedosphaera sp.]